jgi:hypothetical protein
MNEAINYVDAAAAERLDGYRECSDRCHRDAKADNIIALCWPSTAPAPAEEPLLDCFCPLPIPKEPVVWGQQDQKQKRRLERLRSMHDIFRAEERDDDASLV